MQPEVDVLAHLYRPDDVRPASILIGCRRATICNCSTRATADTCAGCRRSESQRDGERFQLWLHIVLARWAVGAALLNGFDDDGYPLTTADAGGAESVAFPLCA